MIIEFILLFALVFAMYVSAPIWSWSKNWGFFPMTICGVILLVLHILILTGKI